MFNEEYPSKIEPEVLNGHGWFLVGCVLGVLIFFGFLRLLVPIFP